VAATINMRTCRFFFVGKLIFRRCDFNGRLATHLSYGHCRLGCWGFLHSALLPCICPPCRRAGHGPRVDFVFARQVA
jgi:hypothetical protein